MTDRPEYKLDIVFNGRLFNRTVIDQHYRKKHKDISDELILKLVRTLDAENIDPVVTVNDFEYFSIEPVFLQEKAYRLILTVCKKDNYIGVINAFRVRKNRK